MEQPVQHDSGPDLDRLRQLILGLEHDELLRLLRLLSDRSQRTDAVAEVVTEALRQRNDADSSVGMALEATIENSLRGSIRRDPAPLAEAIYPVIGPSIRKAISSAIMDMIDSLNRTVNEQFSLRAMRWRFKAWRAGVPYAEYLLLNNITYAVEQVFVIHKDTGLLLQHLSGNTEVEADPDMVSGMLTAIQDFIRDSFDPGAESADLRSMRAGDRTVVLEPGAYAVTALVVNGNPPASKLAELADAADKLHAGWGAYLAEFDGDSTVFESAREVLDPLLEGGGELAEDDGPSWSWRRAWPALLAGVVLAALFGWWQWQDYLFSERAQALLAALDAEPGYVVTRFAAARPVVAVQGLRDADARSLADVATGLLGDDDQFDWRPYFAADAEIVAARIRNALDLPAGAGLEIVDNAAVVTGEVPRQWVPRATATLRALPGRFVLDTTGATLLDSAATRLDRLQEAVEAERLYFDEGSAALREADLETLGRVAEQLQSILGEAELEPRFVVFGQSDFSGSLTTNRQLSRARAEMLRDALIERGVPEQLLATRALISTESTAEARLARITVEWP